MKNSFYQESVIKEQLIEFLKHADRLSMHEECYNFENVFSKYQNRKYTTLVNSGSSANLALLQAMLNLGYLVKGDTVAFTALTWATNVMPILQLGLVPYPVDIELDTLNSSSTLFQEAISNAPNKIKAFFITNVLGFCDDIDKIEEICKAQNILLIEDNCESLGTVYKGRKLGNYSLASTFSFFVGHHLSAIEGGAICTDDEELGQMLIMTRAHGWDRNLTSEKQKSLREKHNIDPFYDQYTFYELGYNIRPTEITGFLATKQLQFADEIISKRASNFKRLHDASLENADIVPLNVEHIEKVSNFAFPVIFREKALFEIYKKKFLEAGVEIRPVVGGSMLSQPFYKKYCESDAKSPNAELVHQNGFYLPNNPDLDEKEVATLGELLKAKVALPVNQ
ncbi:DegT/DnrJ/EryC1/StrS aminotransferase family protein [Chitinophaga sp. SYP-B3965]|nr:DegT/DnrJ/EryC1/StrS aminotransferase family protein [Chitinophaga sp. SYP-B3965]